jgi:hypothetical protein
MLDFLLDPLFEAAGGMLEEFILNALLNGSGPATGRMRRRTLASV